MAKAIGKAAVLTLALVGAWALIQAVAHSRSSSDEQVNPLTEVGVYRSAPVREIRSTYDELKDETTVRLEPVLLTEPSDSQAVALSLQAEYQGQRLDDALAVDTEFSLYPVYAEYVDLHLMIDGERSEVAMHKVWPGRRVEFNFSRDQLARISAATSVSGRLGTIDFSVGPAARSAIAEFLKATEPPPPPPAAVAPAKPKERPRVHYPWG